MSKELDLIGIGYPSLDYVIKLNQVPEPGKTSTIISNNGTQAHFGGCAVNISYLLSHLGYQCGLTMTVGHDFATSGFETFLLDQGINLSYVKRNHDYETSYTKLIMLPNGEHITLFYPGPMTKTLWDPMNYENLNAKYALFTIGEINANKHFLDTCIRKNIPVIFSMKGDYDSLDKEYLEKIMSYSQIIFMNETEYEQLNKYMQNPVKSYLDQGDVLVITLGSKGTKVLQNGHEIFVPSFPTNKVKDTSGGGDAFIAGFLSCYLNEKDLKEAAAYGNALASYIIEEYGCLTNIPEKNEIEERVKTIKEIENE